MKKLHSFRALRVKEKGKPVAEMKNLSFAEATALKEKEPTIRIQEAYGSGSRIVYKDLEDKK